MPARVRPATEQAPLCRLGPGIRSGHCQESVRHRSAARQPGRQVITLGGGIFKDNNFSPARETLGIKGTYDGILLNFGIFIDLQANTGGSGFFKVRNLDKYVLIPAEAVRARRPTVLKASVADCSVRRKSPTWVSWLLPTLMACYACCKT